MPMRSVHAAFFTLALTFVSCAGLAPAGAQQPAAPAEPTWGTAQITNFLLNAKIFRKM